MTLKDGLLKRYHFSAIDSTMTISEKWRKLYVTDKISYLFSADKQISGQGQHQNTWTSPEGNSYTSFLVKCKPELAVYGP